VFGRCRFALEHPEGADQSKDQKVTAGIHPEQAPDAEAAVTLAIQPQHVGDRQVAGRLKQAKSRAGAVRPVPENVGHERQ